MTYQSLVEKIDEADALFNRGLYQKAIQHYDALLELDEELQEEHIKDLYAEISFTRAEALLIVHPTIGVSALEESIIRYRPHPGVNDAHFALGSHHYNKRDYLEAIDNFKEINWDYFDSQKREEGIFKQSYCRFVRKEFRQSILGFEQIENPKGPYYNQALYYHAMAAYFIDDYDLAGRLFESLKDVRSYKADIPNYLAQIYFAQEEYDKVISYGERALNNTGVKNTTSLNQLIGQSYYQKGNYEKALPYLETFANGADKLTAEEFYQIAITQYELGQYQKAITNFKEVSNLNTAIGTNANYYIADSYLKLQDKTSAQAALSTLLAKDLPQEELNEIEYNYAKLSAELGNTSDAIRVLSQIKSSSRYYQESKSLMVSLLSASQDYDAILDILKTIEPLDGELKEVHQKTYFSRATQLYIDGNLIPAQLDFEQSLKYPVQSLLTAEAYFWLASIEMEDNNLDKSNTLFKKYIDTHPDGRSSNAVNPFLANYQRGYNFLKLRNQKQALQSFDRAIDYGSRNPKGKSAKIFADAYLRSADLNFKNKNLKKAFARYKDYTKFKQKNNDYAMYQMATISGLSGEPYDQLVLLEELVEQMPNSEYADDALLDVGDSYIRLNKNDAARSTFVRVITDFSNSPMINKAYLKLGLLSYNQGDIPQATKYYKAIFDNNPSPAEADEALAALEEIYVDDLAQPDEYVNIREGLDGYAVEDNAKDSLIYRSGEIQFKNGKYEKAIQSYNEYLKKYPNGKYALEVYYGRAISLTELKQYTQALSDYEQIIAKGTSQYYEEAIEKSAIIAYVNEEDFDKALEHYGKLEATSKDPLKIKNAQYYSMRSAFAIQNETLATNYAIKLIDNPNVDVEELSYAHYILGKSYYTQNKYAEASKNLEEVLSISTAEIAAESRYLIAEINFRQKNIELAEKQCKLANSKIASYPYWVAKHIILLADIYVEKKDLYNAKAALDVIVENYKRDDGIKPEAARKLGLVENMIANQNRVIDRANSDTLQLIHNNNN